MRPPARPRVPTPPPARPVAPRPAPRAAAAPGPTAGGPSTAEPAAGSATVLARPDARPPAWQPRRAAVVSSGSAARFAERVRMRRRVRRDQALTWAGVLAAVAALGWVVLGSPVLALDPGSVEVSIDGDAAVVDVAAVTAILTEQAGTPLPRLDTVALRRAVLDVPGVRAASVSRSWPHGLQATVVARDPVAAVPVDGGVALLDVDGVQVGRADVAPAGLPVVEVPLGEPATMLAVLTVLEQLPVDLSADVVGASAVNPDAVRLELADGAAVEWGSADRSALKAAVLTTLRAGTAGVQVYDVSAPTLPITRS